MTYGFLKVITKKQFMKRRDFLKSSGFAAVSASALSMLPSCASMRQILRAEKKRPNIIFFFSDDQRFDTIAALGNEHIITPNLDWIVRNGIAFTNAYMMGGMTGATCVPSRAMLLSGRGLFGLDEKGKTIPPEHTTLPEVLRKVGYTTFHTGKWHNDRQSLARGFSGGAMIFGLGGYLTDHFRMPVHDFDPTGEYRRDRAYLAAGSDAKLRLPVSKTSKKGIHSSRLFSNAVIDLLSDYKDDRPFFIYLAYHAPHDPRHAPKRYHDMYNPDQIPLPKNFLAAHPFDNGELRVRDEKLAPWPRTPKVIRQHIADYYAIITHMDAQIGRVLKVLKETRLAENTIIVFAADSGLAVGQHGLMGKQNLYEASGVHVPLIFSGPGIPKGQKRDALCYLLDVFPTLCELADVTIPSSVEGKSLVPVMRSSKQQVRETLYFAYRDFQRAVRDRRYKLIEYVVAPSKRNNWKSTRQTQLFDLLSDPDEMTNLADDPAYAGQLKRLRKEMVRLKDQTGDRSQEFWKGYESG